MLCYHAYNLWVQHGGAYISLALVVFAALRHNAAGVGLARRAPIRPAQAQGTYLVPHVQCDLPQGVRWHVADLIKWSNTCRLLVLGGQHGRHSNAWFLP